METVVAGLISYYLLDSKQSGMGHCHTGKGHCGKGGHVGSGRKRKRKRKRKRRT